MRRREVTRAGLFIADIGQNLVQFCDQRMVVRQNALQSVDRVSQERAGVAVSSQLAVYAGQLRTASG
jgi:hypothetical protein